MQLVAYGAQDIYLVEIHKLLFSGRYTDVTLISQECIGQTISGTSNPANTANEDRWYCNCIRGR